MESAAGSGAGESENVLAATDSHQHPAGSTRGDGTRRDGTGGTGAGRQAPRAKTGCSILEPQAARDGPGPAVTQPRGRQPSREET